MIISFRQFPRYYTSYYTDILHAKCSCQIVWSYEHSDDFPNDLFTSVQYDEIKSYLNKHFSSIKIEHVIYGKDFHYDDKRFILGISPTMIEEDAAFFVLFANNRHEI